MSRTTTAQIPGTCDKELLGQSYSHLCPTWTTHAMLRKLTMAHTCNRVLNKSGRFHRLFHVNSPPTFLWKKKTIPKSQNLTMSVSCSNTLIFASEFWKCILRGPDLTPSNLCFQRSQVTPVVRVFSVSAYSKAFVTYLKPYWKPCM